MRLQYIHPPEDRPLFKFIFVAEAMLIIINFLAFSGAIYVVNNTVFHINLRTLAIVMILSYYLSLLSRAVLILYETKILTFEGTSDLSIIIIVASIFRMYIMAIAIHGIFFIFAERLLATLYVIDYETNERRHIGVMLSFMCCIGAMAGSLVFTFELIDWWILAWLSLFGTLSSVGLYFYLYNINVNRRRCLSRNHRAQEFNYTLSIRYQLDEIIRTMELLRTSMFYLGFTVAFCFVLFASSNSEYFRQIDSGIPAMYLDVFFNITVAINAGLLLLASLLTNVDFMKTVKGSKYLKWIVFWWNPVVEPKVQLDSMEIYFNTLENQWEQSLVETRKKSSTVSMSAIMMKYRPETSN